MLLSDAALHEVRPRLGRDSLLPPTRGRFQLAFTDPVAVAFNGGNVGVMKQTIEQGDYASGVGEDCVPFPEAAIGRQDDGFAFVSPVDDLIKQIRGLVVKREISDLVNA